MKPPISRTTAPILALLLSTGCDSRGETASELEAAEATEQTTEAPPAPEAEPGPPEAGPIPEAWVAERVADARRRLDATDAGRLVGQAIEAHGGLETWLSSGTLAFEFDYAPIENPERRKHTENRIDLWRARAWQREVGDDPRATLGWDGERAWITPGPDAFAAPARFWATTPYYFVGIPFVLGDPGTRFEQLEDAELEGETHHLVKITYEPGTGDSPDDYYIVYIHPETHRVNGLRYVVAYPGFFPEGGHTPEKLMLYTEQRGVGGLIFSHDMDAYAWDAEAGERGEKVTEITVSDVALGERWPAELFAPPEGAVVSTRIERRE